MEMPMRPHYIVAVVAVLLSGLVAKQFLLPPKQAAADVVVPSASQNVLQMQFDTNAKALPVENMNDRTFIFTNEE